MKEEALKLHKDHQGKIAMVSKVPAATAEDLSLAYSPGVAEPCKEIHHRVETVYDYTAKGNLVAVVSNGTAVLGLGNIGPEAALPVMEGKALLFKTFGGVDAWPLCIDAHEVDEVIDFVKKVAPTFGGINLEDIAAPACFEIEERLKKLVNIPVFHDDQHGTAIVSLAALMNAVKVVNKSLQEIKVVVSGAGAAGIATVKLLLSSGVYSVIMCDTKGAIYEGRDHMNPLKEWIAKNTNHEHVKGSLEEVIVDADVFIGVSVANTVTQDMVRSMAKDPIILAMANPDPEILPELAMEAGAKVIGTGRSDYPNQVNNVLAFPGIFRGALDTRAYAINEPMKIAAANAIAALVKEEELCAEYVIPKACDHRVAPKVAEAVAQAAMDSGVARLHVKASDVAEHTRHLIDKPE